MAILWAPARLASRIERSSALVAKGVNGGCSTLPSTGGTTLVTNSDGTYDELLPGPNLYNSLPGDALVYSLAFATQSIKLGWAYLEVAGPAAFLPQVVPRLPPHQQPSRGESAEKVAAHDDGRQKPGRRGKHGQKVMPAAHPFVQRRRGGPPLAQLPEAKPRATRGDRGA